MAEYDDEYGMRLLTAGFSALSDANSFIAEGSPQPGPVRPWRFKFVGRFKRK